MGEKRKTGTSKSTNSDSNNESDGPFIPTKKLRSENVKLESLPVKGIHQAPMVTTSDLQPADSEENKDSDSDSEVDGPLTKQHASASVLENSNGLHSTSSTQSSHVQVGIDTPAVRIEGQKHAATQLKEARKARVSFASARTTSAPKPFVPLDPASIRRGFQEGGVSAKKGTSNEDCY